MSSAVPLPVSNSYVGPMLTDLYQITMAYAYWKSGRHNDQAVFELFFRTSPFKGEFAVFAGLDEAIRFVHGFKFTEADIAYLRTVLVSAEEDFFRYLIELDCSKIQMYAMREGSVVFPREPLIRIEGPLAVGQLLETTLLNLCNFPSLIATNAVRFRMAVGPKKSLLEFGLRRAQGPDGGVSASRFSYLGGFDGTSNVLAGQMFGIPIKGTHAHAFVQSFSSLEGLAPCIVAGHDLLAMATGYRAQLGFKTNDGELAAFVSYAAAFPSGFLALVDTYNTLESGVPNFIAVALALMDLGHRPLGFRLDSGDLSYLSLHARAMLNEVATRLSPPRPELAGVSIVASNDINEAVLLSLNEQGHSIDTFGIGTHLVTCQAQPALGMVYKLVEVSGEARIKLSEDSKKVTIPGVKNVYRLLSASGVPLLDVMARRGEPEPEAGGRTLVIHPYDALKRAYVCPSQVVPLLHLVWDGANGGLKVPLPSLNELRDFTKSQLASIRPDVLRSLNPTPYKVSVTASLFAFMHELWSREAPVAELS